MSLNEEPKDDINRMYPLHSLLPTCIRRRIKALKKLQFQTTLIQANFYQEVHKLECRFIGQCGEATSMRSGIVSGRVEPTDEDCDLKEGYQSPEEEEEGPLVKELREKLTITRDVEAGALGIPEFWLTALKNGSYTGDLVCPHDELPLRHLVDIRVTGREGGPMSFTLHFHFEHNPFFSNKVLTKEYVMKCEVDEGAPWSFDGPEIVSTKGCTINWNKGMDVTQKTVQKKQRHKTRSGQVRTVIKTVKNDSFFNFFSPPSMEPPLDLHRMGLLDLDFEVGSFIREKIVPRAVLYFTGEAMDDSSSEESSSSSQCSSCVEDNQTLQEGSGDPV